MRKRLLFTALLLGLVAVSAYAQAPVPFINLPLVPDAVVPGGPGFTLTINGTGFVSDSVVNWNGSARATTFVSGSQLTASIPASDIAKASTAWVTVVNPAPGGGTSSVAFFTVTYDTGASVAFSLASSPATGVYPYSVAVGDFNGDGKLDLAVANQCGSGNGCSSGTVSILLGDGTGNFTLASSPATGGAPVSVAVGDFNGDGKLDLAVANQRDNTVSILLGDGTGNFTLASSPATGLEPLSVAVGDFNGDGKLDLAVTNVCGSGPCPSPSTVSILLGDGTGNFTLASSPATAGYLPLSVVVGDFNGDGKLDLAVVNECGDFYCNSSGTVSILLGDGRGNFTLASSSAAVGYPRSVAVGDFNGDGKLDLAVTNYDTVSILLGDGTGNFTLASSLATGSASYSLAVGDFNGDGKLDLAVANGCGSDPYCNPPSPAGTVSILLGDGTGNFTLASSPATGWGPDSVAVGDFNGDGRLDLAVANYGSSTVSILLHTTVVLSKASESFLVRTVGITSPTQNVKLTNVGGALHITGITLTGTNAGDFAQQNNCGASLPSGKSCHIGITFTPTAEGVRAASVSIADNAPGSPQTLALTGRGTFFTGSPSSLSFGDQPVGTPSATQTTTITNAGPTAMTIWWIGIEGANPGDFAQTNTCGASLNPGASCTVSVTFTPSASGARSGLVVVKDSAFEHPHKVSLSGNGT